MHDRTSLQQLSSEQKDELILVLQAHIGKQQKQSDELLQMVAALQARLNMNSRNSSKPPSSDGLNKPSPKSLRPTGQRSIGGQKGHRGSTLSQTLEPDRTVVHDVPDLCDACQQKLPMAYAGERRQAWELPQVKREVIEHLSMQAICSCGHVHNGRFPVGVNATVQYGPRAQAAMVHLNQNHAVSLQRTTMLMEDFFDLPVSQATVINAAHAGAEILQPAAQAIGQACVAQVVLHADETGTKVAKSLAWLHILATDTLTWMGCPPKRAGEAFEALALLNQFRGVLVHDGWMPYKALDCQHALCNAHHLRELTYLFEEQGQAWAGDMIELLTHANHTDNVNCADGKKPRYGAQKYQTQVRELRDLYEAILVAGEAQNPIAPATGKRARAKQSKAKQSKAKQSKAKQSKAKQSKAKQSKATNLLWRLRDYSDDVWRFMTQDHVPFTNNVAEQAVRMPKVKQKVSGCFRTFKGAQTYCTIRTYGATMHKQGANIFESLSAAFKGQTPLPSFG